MNRSMKVLCMVVVATLLLVAESALGFPRTPTQLNRRISRDLVDRDAVPTAGSAGVTGGTPQKLSVAKGNPGSHTVGALPCLI
jgi:hypothetical protein